MTISTDFERWIGFSNDPAEVDGWCFWIRIRSRGFYLAKRENQRPEFRKIRE